ncbi:rhodanese-like domain-containing protein [Rubritalea tangerina]
MVIRILALMFMGVAMGMATEIVDVSAKQAAALLKSKNPPQVIDVRTKGEHGSGHLKNAVVIDVKDKGFEAQLAKLDKKKPYLVHCRSGGRSGKAMAVFKKLGFEKIYHMNKGMLSWEKEGLPVEK